jgi:heme exporter protein A
VQSDSPYLQAENVCCVRGERTLFVDLGFNLDAGQCLHIIGPNGSGKTSLLRILVGLSQPENGRICWQGESIANNPNYLSQSAYLGHKDGLKDELTAFENLRFYHQIENQNDEDLVDDQLAEMGILECADLTASKLSFGQRRRLAFARLLLGQFKLWILDEPFTGIDHQGRELIEGICLSHLKNGGAII